MDSWEPDVKRKRYGESANLTHRKGPGAKDVLWVLLDKMRRKEESVSAMFTSSFPGESESAHLAVSLKDPLCYLRLPLADSTSSIASQQAGARLELLIACRIYQGDHRGNALHFDFEVRCSCPCRRQRLT